LSRLASVFGSGVDSDQNVLGRWFDGARSQKIGAREQVTLKLCKRSAAPIGRIEVRTPSTVRFAPTTDMERTV
jgi:hypothetical protein